MCSEESRSAVESVEKQGGADLALQPIEIERVEPNNLTHARRFLCCMGEKEQAADRSGVLTVDYQRVTNGQSGKTSEPKGN